MLGTIKGRADLTLYYKETAYFFELKVGKDKQSDEQIAWSELVREHGFKYFIIKENPERFKELIMQITHPDNNIINDDTLLKF